jgi:signal transduction histidine kinase
MIQRNGELLRNSLVELLDGFRPDVQPQPVSLHDVLDRAVTYAITGDVNVRRRISVIKDLCEPAPIVSGSAGALLHLFLNLLVNARQAMADTDGSIIVRTAWDNATFLTITIQDSGPGIPIDVLPTLFKARRSTKARGSGFGLSMCRDIVERHGGTISASNAPSGGACFAIRLPAAAATHP